MVADVPCADNCNAVFVEDVPVPLLMLMTAPKLFALAGLFPVIEISKPRPVELAVDVLVITRFLAEDAVVPDIPRLRTDPVVTVVDVKEATFPLRLLAV